MSLHRALECLDVIEGIFQRFSSTREDRQTLARAARVCKAFADPALDALWETLDDIIPAFRLLPSLAVVFDEHGFQVDVTFGIIPQDAWDRFQQYARRVRKLTVMSPASALMEAPSRPLEQLAQRGGGQVVFPRLERLTWRQEYLSRSNRNILLLIPSSLEALSIQGVIRDSGGETSWQWLEASQDLLRTIFSRAPRLQAFAISGIVHPRALVSIRALPALRQVHIVSRIINLQAIRVLASFPYLVELSIHARFTIPDDSGCIGFPVLKDLSVRGTQMEHTPELVNRLPSIELTHLLSTILSPSVRTLSANIRADEDGQLEPLLSLIASKYRSLRVLSLEVDNAAPDTRSFSGVLRPLVSLRVLRIIRIRLLYSMLLPAELLVDMAMAWPEAIEVTLFAETPSIDTSIPVDAVYVLTEFARLCPKLETLELPYLDFQHPPSLDTLTATKGHGLRSLGVSAYSNMSIEDHAQVAHFVDTVFPKLAIDSQLNWLPLEEGYDSRMNWKRVLELMKELRRERESSSGQIGTRNSLGESNM